MNPVWVFELRSIGNVPLSIPDWVSTVAGYMSPGQKRRDLRELIGNFPYYRKSLSTRPLLYTHMDTGISLLIKIEMLVTWETQYYPAQHRREGSILTPAGEIVPFVPDRQIPETNVDRAIAWRTNRMVEVADLITGSKV
jgi:hypothetical protein